jgi:hypothetical protein
MQIKGKRQREKGKELNDLLNMKANVGVGGRWERWQSLLRL